jgi:HTH-type transcriptional regulator / antitoxin HigA
MINGLPDYPGLLQSYLPRPITSEAQYDQVVSQVNSLIDREELSPAEQEMLNLLGTLLMVYENEHYPDEQFTLRGIDLIHALMVEHQLKQIDLLPIFKTKSIVSAVLSGKRRLTVEHINRLAEFFSLPHELFFEPLANEKTLMLTA